MGKYFHTFLRWRRVGSKEGAYEQAVEHLVDGRELFFVAPLLLIERDLSSSPLSDILAHSLKLWRGYYVS